MKRNRWILFIALVVLALALVGCGVTGGDDIDIRQDAPDGVWQSFVVWPLAKGLLWLHDLLAGANVIYNWGFAIILFTIIIRIIMFPLTLTQIRGMEAQKSLQPKLQELQKKYGKDREKMSQEQMKLYRESGVNPLGGCLPLVVQMPVLFGLYSALIVLGNELANARFFWIPDLGFPSYTGGLSWISEDFNNGDFGHLAAYLVLPILLVASQFVMQKWMTPATPTTGDNNSQAAMMKQVGLMMTFMFGFFTLQVPAGLSLYWVTSNLLQMLQQWAIMGGKLGLGAATVPALATAGGSTDTVPPASANGTGPSDDSAQDKPSSEKTKPPSSRSKKSNRRRAKRK